MEKTYYCATGDDEHFNEFGETTLIFEALCSYYDGINNPEEGELEIEMGYYTIKDGFKDDYITMMFHSFEEETSN